MPENSSKVKRSIWRKPSSEHAKKICKTALNKLLARYTSKNHMARELGVSRNCVSWWFSKGYVGHMVAIDLHEKGIIDIKDTRPDLANSEFLHPDRRKGAQPDEQ